MEQTIDAPPGNGSWLKCPSRQAQRPAEEAKNTISCSCTCVFICVHGIAAIWVRQYVGEQGRKVQGEEISLFCTESVGSGVVL